MRVLLVKTSSLGDVIHNLPVASDLLRRFPDISIDWVVEESFADIPALHPAVGVIYRVALRRWKKAPFSAATRTEIQRFRHGLQALNYDLVIDTQGLIKSAWVTRQACGPSAGYGWRSIREPLASLAYTRRYTVPRHLHAVERNRALAAAALGYSLDDLPLDYGLAHLGTPADSSAQTAEGAVNNLSHGDFLRSQKNASSAARPEAILLTATSRDDKLWPEDHWIALGTALTAQGLRCVLPSGSTIERARAHRIAEAIPDAEALGAAGIHDLAGRIAGARCAVGVDTGLTHLACATGIPTIALYTATDPGLTGVAGPCFHRNLGGKNQSPSVDAVLAALAEALTINPVASAVSDQAT